MSPAGSSQCLVNVLGRAAVLRWKRGRTLGRDPSGGAMRWTEAALSPGMPGGQAVALDMVILLKGNLLLYFLLSINYVRIR